MTQLALHRQWSWGGPAAVIGGLLSTTLIVLETYDFHHAGTEVAWVNAARPLLTPLLARISPSLRLNMFGRAQLFGFLLLLIGVVSLHARSRALGLGKWHQRGCWMAGTGLVLALFGNVGDMWLGPYWWDAPGTWIAVLGGLLFLGLPLGALVYSLGSLVIGIALVRHRALPIWVGWLLITAGVTSVHVGFQVVQGVSAAYILLAMAWSVVGYTLWSNDRKAELLTPA